MQPRSAYHHLYNTARWKALRKQQLQSQPLCERCLERGKVRAATVAHHKEPHKGDEQLFFAGALASSCKPCHDSTEQQIERIGYSTEIGADGFAVDPLHPSNR